jgi:hypothetical protein
MNQSILNKSRNDKFIFLFALPKALDNLYDPKLKSDFNDDKVQLSIYNMSVPDISIPSISLGYGGQTYKTSSFSRPDYPSMDIRFFIDNGYHNYYILWNWLNLFNDSRNSSSEILRSAEVPPNPELELENQFPDYTTTLTIITLDEYNRKLIKFQYEGAFITSLGGINYSHQDGVEITSTASFSYNQINVSLESNVNENVCK